MTMIGAIHKKVVVVGDGSCGKTCLLTVFVRGEFKEQYVPTIFEESVVQTTVDNKLIDLALWDTAGQEDYARLRPLAYPDSDVIIVCFSVDIPDSLDNVTTKWVPEVRHHCPHLPIVLACCKIDLRNDAAAIERAKQAGISFVTPAMGGKVAEKNGFCQYIECSAKRNEGVTELFQAAAKAALSSRFRRRGVCAIL